MVVTESGISISNNDVQSENMVELMAEREVERVTVATKQDCIWKCVM